MISGKRSARQHDEADEEKPALREARRIPLPPEKEESERHDNIIRPALLEAERTGRVATDDLESPCGKDREGGDDGDGEGRLKYW